MHLPKSAGWGMRVAKAVSNALRRELPEEPMKTPLAWESNIDGRRFRVEIREVPSSSTVASASEPAGDSA